MVSAEPAATLWEKGERMAQTTMAGAQAPRIPGPAGMVALLICGHFAIIGLFSIGVDLPRIAGAFADVPHARLFA